MLCSLVKLFLHLHIVHSKPLPLKILSLSLPLSTAISCHLEPTKLYSRTAHWFQIVEWLVSQPKCKREKHRGWDGSAEGRGCLIVSGGQKGGKVWTIPEQRRWYGGGGGGRSAHVITREDNRLVSLQAASSRCGGNWASSDFLFVFQRLHLQTILVVCIRMATWLHQNKKGLSVLCWFNRII